MGGGGAWIDPAVTESSRLHPRVWVQRHGSVGAIHHSLDVANVARQSTPSVSLQRGFLAYHASSRKHAPHRT